MEGRTLLAPISRGSGLVLAFRAANRLRERLGSAAALYLTSVPDVRSAKTPTGLTGRGVSATTAMPNR